MPGTVRHSLERRLFITLGLTAVVFSVIAGSADFVRTYTNELERNRTTLDNLAATVHSSAAIAAFVNNDAIGTDVIDGLLRNDIILAASIEGDRGYHLLRWREGISQNWQEESVLAYPLGSPTEPGTRIGTLKILTHADLITERARTAAMLQMAILVLQSGLIALVMLIGFRRFVGRPITGLARQLVNTRPGSPQRVEVAEVHKDNEIGLLARSVNSYLEASEQAILAERELRERVETMETHYKRIFESTRVGVMVLDMYGGLINCNALLNEIASYSATDPPAEPSFDAPVDFIPRIFKYPQKAWALIERVRTDEQIGSGDLELVEYDGKQHWSHCLFSLQQFPENDLYYIEAVLYDVTSRRKREEDALRNAERDPLTNLANRFAAETWLARSLQEAEAAGRSVTVLFMDLDGFKEVNDQYGHAAGDLVLAEVARRLGQVRRRSSDLLARLGGDEFLLAAYGLHKNHPTSHMLAQAILEVMQSPISLAGNEVRIGISIGVASHPENGSDCNTLLASADAAMYEAKHQGKNRIVAAPDPPGKS